MTTTEITPLLPSPVSDRLSADVTAASANSAAADFDTFLKLLTAQLENQDPLAPLDSTEFVAQLASFSAVEQQVGTNERLDLLTAQALNEDLATFAGWIGHEVASLDGSFRSTGDAVTFRVPDSPGITSVEATVRDSSGAARTSFPVTVGPDGMAIWDSSSDPGLVGQDLTIELALIGAEGASQTTMAEVMRVVSGVHGTAAGPVLDLADGGTLLPDAVSRVSAAPGIL